MPPRRYETKTRSCQSYREYGTQMKRVDLVMDDGGDVEIVSKRYFTASQMLELQRQKTLAIQRYWRGYLARRRTWGIRQRLYERQLAEEQSSHDTLLKQERRRQFEVERRVNPRSCKDFALLYNELEAWRAHEIAKVEQRVDVTEAERKVSLTRQSPRLARARVFLPQSSRVYIYVPELLCVCAWPVRVRASSSERYRDTFRGAFRNK